MKPKYQLVLFFCILTRAASAQQGEFTRFHMGDTAPPIRVREWIKGTPVQRFEKGKVYVVEFWATWCKPCIAAMPHLSALAREHRDEVTVLAIDVHEKKTTSIAQVKTFVDHMGNRMDFPVVTEDTSFTVHDWLEASDEKGSGIPITFVVNAQGRVAWIGHPVHLDTVLRKVLNNTWDIRDALAQKKFNKYLEDLDREAGYKLSRYEGEYNNLDDLGKPDSTLLVINEMVRKEPRLKYAPIIALFTFPALLKTNPHKAYEYGKELIVSSTYDEPAYGAIIVNIKDYSRKLTIPMEIYRLGAEACQAEIDHLPYPEIADVPGKYRKMAAWYRLAGDESKARGAEQKAIKFTDNNLNAVK